jgi:uncharacterized membrane protein YhaH (DUF805 family)
MGIDQTGDLRLPLRGASFGAAIGRFFKKYADFDGRASRSEYWYSFLFRALVGLIFIIPILGWVIGILFALACIIPGIAINARRLHDTGLSGWLQLIVLVPVLGGIALIVLMAMPPNPKGDKYGPSGITA